MHQNCSVFLFGKMLQSCKYFLDITNIELAGIDNDVPGYYNSLYDYQRQQSSVEEEKSGQFWLLGENNSRTNLLSSSYLEESSGCLQVQYRRRS